MKYQTIEKIFSKLDIQTVSFKIQITLLKNKNLLRESFELIQEIKKRVLPEGYIEFHTNLKNLHEKYCEHPSENVYVPRSETKHEFDKDVYDLKEANKEIIEKYVENERLFNEFLQESIEIPLYKYSLEDLPEDLDSFSKDELEMLFEFINN